MITRWKISKEQDPYMKYLISISFIFAMFGCNVDLPYDALNSALMKEAPGWVKVVKYTNKEFPAVEVVRIFMSKEEVRDEYIELAELEVIENVNVSSMGPNLLNTYKSGTTLVSDETVYIVMTNSFLKKSKELGADALILLDRGGYNVIKETRGIGNTKYRSSIVNLDSSKTEKIYIKALAIKFK